MAKKQPKRTRRTKRPNTNGTQEKALDLPPVAGMTTNPFNEGERIGRRAGTLWLNRGNGSGCPAYWSRNLDAYLEGMENENDYAGLIATKFGNKASSRAFSLKPTQDSEISTEAIREMEDLLFRGGNGLPSFEAIAEVSFKSCAVFCNGFFIFALGNSEEAELPDDLGFSEGNKRKAYGPLVPLEDESGEILTYEDGTPIYTYGFMPLDTMRCTRTGNYEWPVIYEPYGKSERYLLHRSRVIDMVFSPATDNRYNGVGKSALYVARDTLRQLKGNQRVQLEFTGEDKRQAVLVVEQGPGTKEVREGWETADERIDNANVQDNEIPVLGYANGTQGDEKFVMKLIDINKLPDGFDYAEQLTHGIAVAGAAAYLTLAELGLSNLARMTSRANAEIEADSASSSGIPQLQEALAMLINQHLPEGVEFVWEATNTRDAKEQAELDQIEADTLNSYIASGVLSALNVLDALHAKGDIPDDVYEQRRAVLIGGAVAEATQEEVKQIKRRSKAVEVSPVTDAIDNDETEELQELFNEALIAQYLSANVDRIIRQARSAGIDDPEATNYVEQLIPIVEENADPIEDSLDVNEALLLLAFFASLGRIDGSEQVNRELTALELATTQGQTDTWIVNRLRSLLGDNPEGIPVPASGQPLDIRNPLVPQGLDETSYRRIAELIRTSQLQTDTIADAVEGYEELVPQTTEGRAKVIAEDNASSTFGSALWYYVAITAPVSKTWLRTVALTPRQVHLDQVGETVPIDGTFADGSFWSQSLINCQCGIRVNYS